ncbi:FAD/NAD(P)-binding protein [Acidipila sp. EB88]|uniref:FAD/NAD(P)-binding protein n=1 Tax=Acidipila sp. EB88 TaxID=2305226 RepID=UPI0013157E04|nr:FAD/NAD(P)-binding protein [Acidipila sp. EB88]
MIAIIGGGVSGALTAFHLIQQRVNARVFVIEPRAQLGFGLAYSTPTLRHLLNVPAGKISAFPAEPEHFLQWLRTHYDPQATAATFAPRAVFGRYISSLMATVRGVEQVQAEVVSYRDAKPGAVLTLSDGATLWADLVVLATGNFAPAPLHGITDTARATGAYAHDAWGAATYSKLDPDSGVTLIGTGLTGVDVLLRLREAGHRGTITAISRHGVFPKHHAAYEPSLDCAIPDGTTPTCLEYLRALRQVIRNGVAWRAAIDSLRATTNDLWMELPRHEQVRFRRHLQRRWDVVRHRMAPSIADVIEAELAAGTLILREGRLAGVENHASGAIVMIRKGGVLETIKTGRVINCTGPNMNYRGVDSALLQNLFAQGLASSGALGGGFHTTRLGALIGADGKISEKLFNLGPGRLGTLLESIAIPELRMQAVEMAALLADRLKSNSSEDSLLMATCPHLTKSEQAA